ncbi:MAG: hypothetical protein KIT31_25535 [Deltaproteobacteria bacterium]|nr:hypothetical protein [Deltaproteobacteria bacterium]
MRIGEMLGALSLATDLAAGLPLEASLRTCIVATHLARTPGLAELGEAARHRCATCASAFARRPRARRQRPTCSRRTLIVDRQRRRVRRRTDDAPRGEALGRRIADGRASRRTPAWGRRCRRAVRRPSRSPATSRCRRAPSRRSPDLPLADGCGGSAPGRRRRVAPPPVRRLRRRAGRDLPSHVGQRRVAVEVAQFVAHLAPEACDAFLAEQGALWDVEAASVGSRLIADEPDEPGLDAERRGKRVRPLRRPLKSPAMLGHPTPSPSSRRRRAVARAGRRRALASPRLCARPGTVSAERRPDKPGPLNAAEWQAARPPRSASSRRRAAVTEVAVTRRAPRR